MHASGHLAQTHSRLAEAHWSGVPLETVLLDELAPYRHENGANLRISGPVTILNAKQALTLGMAMHELATNAAKYGALSTEHGVVEVRWDVEAEGKQLRITWTEHGGPAVAPPTRNGFGRLLIEKVLASDLGGDVSMHFAESGLECVITVPLSVNLPATEDLESPDAGMMKGLRVLIVEDEFLLALSLEDDLVMAGCVTIGPFARLADATRSHAARGFRSGHSRRQSGRRADLSAGRGIAGARQAFPAADRLRGRKPAAAFQELAAAAETLRRRKPVEGDRTRLAEQPVDLSAARVRG